MPSFGRGRRGLATGAAGPTRGRAEAAGPDGCRGARARARRQAGRRRRDAVVDLAADRRFVAEDHRPLDQVLQLAHVAWPVVVHEQPHRLGRDLAMGLVVLDRVLLEEVVGEDRNFFTPLTQGRQLNADDVQPEEQVFTQLAFRHGLLEVAVGGRDDPHVHVHVVLAPQARELAVLQDLQQLGLERRAHLAHFVEEHRAVVGKFKFPSLVLNGTRKRAALKAEELGFEQLGWKRGAVDLHERLVAPKRGRVEGPRHELLAGAALSPDQDGDIGVGHPFDEIVDLGHSFAVAEKQVVFRLRLKLFPDRGHLATELALLQCVGEGHFEIQFVERLVHEVRGPELHRLHDGGRAVLAGQHDDRCTSRSIFLKAGERPEAVHAAGSMTTSRITAAGRSA